MIKERGVFQGKKLLHAWLLRSQKVCDLQDHARVFPIAVNLLCAVPCGVKNLLEASCRFVLVDVVVHVEARKDVFSNGVLSLVRPDENAFPLDVVEEEGVKNPIPVIMAVALAVDRDLVVERVTEDLFRLS